MGPGVVPAAPPVLIFMMLGRATVGAGQVECVLQLAGRPQYVQRVIAQLLQRDAKPDTSSSVIAIHCNPTLAAGLAALSSRGEQMLCSKGLMSHAMLGVP